MCGMRVRECNHKSREYTATCYQYKIIPKHYHIRELSQHIKTTCTAHPKPQNSKAIQQFNMQKHK